MALRRVTQPRIMRLYTDACAELTRAGIALTPKDYAWLFDSAARAVNGPREISPWAELPVTVKGVAFHPRTLGASIWWEETASAWFAADSHEDQLTALAFLHAHAGQPAVFRKLNTRKAACRAIHRWAWGPAFRLTPNDYALAILRLNGDRVPVEIEVPGAPPEAEDPTATDYGATLSILCAAYHLPPAYFLFDLPEASTLDLLKKAPLPNGTRAHAKEHTAEYLEFRRIIAHILQRHEQAASVDLPIPGKNVEDLPTLGKSENPRRASAPPRETNGGIE